MWKKIKDLFSAKLDGEEYPLEEQSRLNSTSGAQCESANEQEAIQSGPNLSELIRQQLAPVLRADGFTGSGRNFRKNHTDWVIILSVETSRAGNAFALNIGIQPKFGPDSLGKEVDPKKIKVQLCEFRRRVFTPEIDVWWKYESDGASMNKALQQAAQAYVQQIRPLVRNLCGEESVFAKIDVGQLSVEAMGFGQFDTTEGRLALALARYHFHRQQWQSCLDFAHLGLKFVGMSVGLQRDLEDLIEATREAQNHVQLETSEQPDGQAKDGVLSEA